MRAARARSCGRTLLRETGGVTVRKDCRHYSTRSTATGEVMQRCRLGANEEFPFACPEGCLFFEPRAITDTGWSRFEQPDE